MFNIQDVGQHAPGRDEPSLLVRYPRSQRWFQPAAKSIRNQAFVCIHDDKGPHSIFDGFDVNAGRHKARMPSIPVGLCAFAIDLLLRTLQPSMPQSTIRAFADDIEVVVPDLAAIIQIVQLMLCKAGRVTGQHLNIPKCVIVPLWLGDTAAAAGDRQRLHSLGRHRSPTTCNIPWL